MSSQYSNVSPEVFNCGALLAIVLFCAQILYNLYFHPLAKIPGPLLARTTHFPSWYHAIKGNRHLWLWKLFQTYGYRIRVTPNTVCFNDPESFRDIYGMKSNVQRSQYYLAWRRNWHEAHTLSAVDPAQHAQKRKYLNQSFHEKSLRTALQIMYQHIDRWNELLTHDKREDWSEPTDFSESGNALIFDVLGDLCFGRSFETKEPGENSLKAMPKITAKYVKFWYPMTRSPFLSLLIWLKPRGLDRIIDMMTPQEGKDLNKFIHERVSERMALRKETDEEKGTEDEGRLDMFHWLCEAKTDSGQPAYNETELRGEATLLVVAGSDTTATILSALFFYLTLPTQSKPLETLTREILERFTSVEEIVNGPKLASCTYLMACIEEAQRLCPSGTSERPREVLAGGITIRGEHYPAGVVVGSPEFSKGRNEEIYGDVSKFRPERWLTHDKTELSRLRSNHHPFSAGPGACPAKSLATLEIQVIIARTLWRTEFRRAPGSALGGGAPGCGWGRTDPNVFQLYDAHIVLRNGPLLQFRQRKKDWPEYFDTA